MSRPVETMTLPYRAISRHRLRRMDGLAIRAAAARARSASRRKLRPSRVGIRHTSKRSCWIGGQHCWVAEGHSRRTVYSLSVARSLYTIVSIASLMNLTAFVLFLGVTVRAMRVPQTFVPTSRTVLADLRFVRSYAFAVWPEDFGKRKGRETDLSMQFQAVARASRVIIVLRQSCAASFVVSFFPRSTSNWPVERQPSMFDTPFWRKYAHRQHINWLL